MKKIITLIIIIGAIGLLYYMRENSLNDEIVTPSEKAGGTFRPDPSSATFIFDDETVTLSKGRNTNDESAEETALLDEIAYGDLNADGKEDTVVLLARSGGGSGVFIYVAAYVSGPVNYKGSNAVFLGDRIAPSNISIANGVVTVSYLDRREDEALAAEPTIEVTKKFVYRNGELEER